MKALTLIALIFSSQVWAAKMATETVRVEKMQWNAGKRNFRLQLKGHAAAYWADKKLEKCLHQSIVDNVDVAITFDVSTLDLEQCKKI